MRFPPTALTPDERRLRTEVRAFLATELADRDARDAFGGYDQEFSRRLAANGWVGMSIPAAYGGTGGTAVKRFVVAAELLAGGAPVAAHWVADRQTAPTILAFGTEEQKQRFLPAIARAECGFSIGMSEPDSGSDLASIRTSAVRTDGGWRVNGTKVWASLAHRQDYVLALVRSSPLAEDRHLGLSQFIIGLRSPGVTVSPIIGLEGGHHFNEVVFNDVFVPDSLVLGEAGGGWRQVSSELAYERSGPDRWLSTYRLFQTYLEHRADPMSPVVRDAVGRITARYRTLHNLSLSVARMIDVGGAPAAEAALVKDLGTTFEKEVAETVRTLAGAVPDPDADDPFGRSLAAAVLTLPGLTIRGGTTEILRGVAARELTGTGPSVRSTEPDGADRLLADTALRIFADHGSRADPEASGSVNTDGWSKELWDDLTAAGLTRVGIAETRGGSGGTRRQAAELVRISGYAAAPVPLAEALLLGGPALVAAGLPLPAGPLAVAPEPGELTATRTADGWTVSGRATRVAWARVAEQVVALAISDDGPVVVVFPATEAEITLGRNLADEPRDTVTVIGARAAAGAVGANPASWRARGALARSLQIAGALERTLELTVRHGRERVQFGRPIARFQAVGQLVTLLGEAVAQARMAAETAVADPGPQDAADTVIAKIIASGAASSGAAHAHQVHGAIGMTREHDLQRFTRRLWSWRDEYGSEAAWAHEFGTCITRGEAAVWDVITGPQQVGTATCAPETTEMP
jgi:alkylation response protein AidB-like acyl-CoA dehydrogenase